MENVIEMSLQQGIEIPYTNNHLDKHHQEVSKVFIYADCQGTPKTDLVTYWVRHCDHHSLMCQVFRQRDTKVLRDVNLLETYADARCQWCGDYTVHSAAMYGDVATMKILVDSGARLDSLNYIGETPLHVACGNGDYKMVQCLLQCGANPNIQDGSGIVPLHISLAKKQIQMVDCLLRYCAEVEVVFSRETKMTPLHMAIKNGVRSVIDSPIEYNVDFMSADMYS